MSGAAERCGPVGVGSLSPTAAGRLQAAGLELRVRRLRRRFTVKKRVLFVCLGNICRSPMAEAMFRAKVREAGLEHVIEIDSAGTGSWNVGKPPDPRAVRTAAHYGVELGGRARQLSAGELSRWDMIIVMDQSNYDDVLGLGAPADKVYKLRDFDPEGPGDVPDPYYGSEAGFHDTYRIIERSLPGLLDALLAR
ncbi:MAG: protein tyrosine phosphatase [Bacillota bacterium]|nr:MAG: protein tyrosine phosphatase [Bacillota bacterium]